MPQMKRTVGNVTLRMACANGEIMQPGIRGQSSNQLLALRVRFPRKMQMESRTAVTCQFERYSTFHTAEFYVRIIKKCVCFQIESLLNLVSFAVPNSRLRSPPINGQTAVTCTLSFSFMSTSGATLDVRQYRPGEVRSLYSTHNPANQWQSFSVDIGKLTAGFQIEFYGESRTKTAFFENIAIDNVQFVHCNPYKTYPTLKPPTLSSVSCTFERNLCGWQVTGTNGRSNWMRTSNPNQEPGNDHTSLQRPRPAESGNWLTTQSQGESDYLVTTATLKGGQTYCFTFWYYYLGIDANSFFALYASKTGKASRTPDSESDYTALWKTAIPILRNWSQKYVEITGQTNDFYLIFIASVDSNGIIGLDDTNLTTGKCPVVDPEFCDFEVNSCDWAIHGGFKLNPSSIKFIDHTTGTENGHYLQDTVEGGAATMRKQMSSLPIFSNSTPGSMGGQSFCLRFFYFISTDLIYEALMDSSSRFTVHLNMFNYKINKSISIVDAFNDGVLSQWAMFQFSFTGKASGYVEIDANLGMPFTRLLLDDISIKQRYCQLHGDCDFEYGKCHRGNPGSI